MLLSEARTRTRRYLDREGDTTLFADTEIDDELKSGQLVAWRLVGDKTNLWTTETTALSTNSAGVCDLSTIKPLRIVSVAITAGGISRWVIRPARVVDGLTNMPFISPLRISYVPRAAFPSAPANPFLWGPGGSGVDIDAALLDRLVCLLAAKALKVKLGDDGVNKSLDEAAAQCREDVKSMLSVPRYNVTLLDGALRRQNAPYFYIMTAADTLQVVV